jgi:hypothetical protein
MQYKHMILGKVLFIVILVSVEDKAINTRLSYSGNTRRTTDDITGA